MLNEKSNSPKGVGVGSLFTGLIREMIPVSKSSIKDLNKVMDDKSMKVMGKTLQKEATDTAVDKTIDLLNRKKITPSKRQRLKKVAENILSKTKHKKSLALSQSKKTPKNRSLAGKKRKLKHNKGPKNKKPLIDDDY